MTVTTPQGTAIVPTASEPAFAVPAGACDTHAHVFGPYRDFPLAPERTYTPPECTGHDYLRLLKTLRFERGVVVQGSAHGQDNRAMLAALALAPDRLRGVAVADRTVSDAMLDSWRAQGVRGLRFSHIPSADGHARYKNVIGIEELLYLAPRMKEHGMHAQLWIHGADLSWLEPLLSALPVPVVIDHMGRFDIRQGTDGDSFANVCRLLGAGKTWLKLTAYRNAPGYQSLEQVRPYHEALLRLNPERLVWGSDWPHVNCTSPMPDSGALATAFARWTESTSLIEQILVHNPAALYGF